ncbi:hypothetical protein RclHR1_01950025 [Rhizophagus clarus]|uniref:RRM domain-containing protein n=1 Tax=Rhizophagus clarus TaxID=94130 RepID=A0A2Z6QNV5_9GLOM|nr:hypothetical protein RclHR1_01950025 [Rhizophagus clarus]GES94636.1 hypothetical protein GLOIN_2v1532743 [Rhizophagus clarus]
MNDVDEIILDFDGNVDFSLSEDPQATNSILVEGDSLFSLESDMNYSTSDQLTEEKFSTEGKNKEDSELTDNQLSENIELNNDSTLSQQKDQDELKFDDFDLDLNEYGGNVDDVTVEDDEFWKELGLDPPNEVEKEGKFNEESETSNNFDTDNANISPKETAPKRSTTSQSDGTKVNTISNIKSKRTSKSPEKEDGEILNASTSADKQIQQQSQKQKLSQSQQQIQTQRQAQTQRTQTQRQQQQNNQQQQNLQNYRGRGGRRNNDWRPINNNNSFLNSGMSSFRPGFGPGLEGMPGMQMGQMPLNNPPMLIPPGMIGPNIHVNPNFARLRPHTLPFGNPMSQYPMGSGGPPMNMMPYQGQMDIHPYHPSITPMTSGRGNNNSYGGRGGSPGFNHNSISPRRPTNQQNNNQTQRPMQPSPKRKVPNDGFEQKEPDSKKISVANGKSPVPDTKSSSALQKNVEKNKAVPSPATKNSSSPPAAKVSNSKQGISITNTNKTASATAKNKISPASNSATSSTLVKQTSKPMQKPTPKNTARNASTKADAASSPISKPTTKADSAPSSGGNKLTIRNVVKNVTRRDIQDLANKVPIGFSTITFDRSAQTAEVEFETPEGAKMFRRMHNRSLLHGSNIVINFS